MSSEKKSPVPYIVRNYRPSDFPHYVLLCQEAEKLEPAGRPVAKAAVRESLARPGYAPEQDLLVVETEGRIIGATSMVPELGIGRFIIDCWLHPEHRRQGLAKKLLSRALRRAREAGAGVVHANIAEDNATARVVLPRLGFRCVRRFHEFTLDMTGSEARMAAGGYRHLRPGEEDKLAQIQNRCFADTWGYNPNTRDSIGYQLRLSHSSPDDVIVTCEGNRITGYCWTEVVNREAASGQGEGRIYMLGVDPDYRGRGLGRRLLGAGLAHLKNRGRSVAVLTVDSENRAACALYRAAGFRIRRSQLWYEKAVT